MLSTACQIGAPHSAKNRPATTTSGGEHLQHFSARFFCTWTAASRSLCAPQCSCNDLRAAGDFCRVRLDAREQFVHVGSGERDKILDQPQSHGVCASYLAQAARLTPSARATSAWLKPALHHPCQTSHSRLLPHRYPIKCEPD